MTGVSEPVDAYVAAIDPLHRPLFDRIRGLIGEVAPDAEVTIAYGMPTFRTERGRVHVGVWKHGVSLYGWGAGGDGGGFLARHPELRHGRGTIRLRTDDTVTDDDLRLLLRAAFGVR